MSKRLLILVDEEPVTTRALALDLSDAGYRVETATNREDAIRISQDGSIDLLIAEEQPGDADRRFVERFRRVQPAAKVVLMSTDGPARERFELRDSHARMRKPFDLEELRSVVGRLLDP